MLFHIRNTEFVEARCIAYIEGVDQGQKIARVWEERFPTLKVRFIEGQTKEGEREEIFDGLKEDLKSQNRVDVVIHCKVLGEGFDENNLCLGVLFNANASIAPFAQFLGRCVRKKERDNHEKCYMISHPGLGAEMLWNAYCRKSTSV